MSDRPANRLAAEKSPYLLQHAHNPVDWYPWGDEAFELARKESKPIFLSIGYSTCHWCHVMERESFENDAVAALLNQHFVPIKVDREERPDVDRIYMAAMQALGVSGGWPLNVFLTPQLEPFFGGTYFPPDTMMGRPGMLQILPRVAEAWQAQRAELASTGAQVLEALSGMGEAEGDGVPRSELLERAAVQLARAYDPVLGGFGGAPKFPSTVNLAFLLRWWAEDREGRGDARAMVERQLDAMQAGGIHDQIGGGFHRYATDANWLVPHFEKMLYDQAQLAWAYLEGFQVAGDPAYAETARGIFAYVARDLTSAEGAFDSAEDADSEGEEGRFYVWTPEQIEAVLGPEEAWLFAHRFGVSAEGNFEGASILHRAMSVEECATAVGIAPDEARTRLDAAAAKLLAARSQRVRPHRDDKVISGWNGLMISAFARGARVLETPDYARRAERAATFVWERLRDPATGVLARRWRQEEAAGKGQLDDHAYVALGFLDLYGATLAPGWLERAGAIAETMVQRFHDPRGGGFFGTPEGDTSIRVRLKEGYDGAEMAGASIAVQVVLALGRLLDNADWVGVAGRALEYYARRLASMPTAMPQMLAAMLNERAPHREVVIAGDKTAADTRALIAAFDRAFLPFDRLLLAGERLARLMPFTAEHTPRGAATAYVCVNRACKQPVTEVVAFEQELGLTAAPRSAV